jgi:hypothetical protein
MRSEGSFSAAGWVGRDLAGLSLQQPTPIRPELTITIDLMQAAIAWFVRKKRARKQKDVRRWISSTGLDGRQGQLLGRLLRTQLPMIPIQLFDTWRYSKIVVKGSFRSRPSSVACNHKLQSMAMVPYDLQLMHERRN